jgi:hypothetical protein
MTKPVIEHSEDRLRGSTMAHLKQAITAVRSMPSTLQCANCRGTATHLIDTRNTPRAVCSGCAKTWNAMSPLQRAQSRNDFARRSR